MKTSLFWLLYIPNLKIVFILLFYYSISHDSISVFRRLRKVGMTKKNKTLMVVSEEAEYKSEVFSSKARDHTVYLCPIKV